MNKPASELIALADDPKVVAAAQQAMMKHPYFEGSATLAFGLARSALKAAIAALSAPLPPVRTDGAVRELEPWRDELSEIIGHLGSAIVQSCAKDDQIIMDHVRAAYEIAKIVRRKA